MKKIISVILACVMICASFGAVSAFAAAASELKAAEVSGKAGDTVSVEVRLSANEGIAGLSYEIGFDRNVITPVKVTVNRRITNLGGGAVAHFASNIDTGSGANLANLNKVTGTYIASEELTGSVLIATYEFKIKNNAPTGASTLRVRVADGDVVDKNGNAVALQPRSGSVTVKSSAGGSIGGGGIGGDTVIPAVSSVKFNMGDGTVKSVTIKKGGILEEPETPVREGYIFAGWYKDSECTERYNFNNTVTSSMELYAKWLPASQLKYSDIEGHWAQSNIIGLSDKGIFSGYEDGTFKPDYGITRQEMAVALVKMLGIENELDGADVSRFTDSDKIGSWAAPYVALLVKKGIYSGYDDGSFNPDMVITREQLCVLLSKTSASDTSGKTTFADIGTTTSAWAEGYVAAMQKAGIVTGYGDNTFMGTNGVTRAEACTMLLNYLGAF